jgi:plastocyanin
MSISRPRLVTALGLAVALVAAGCGPGATTPPAGASTPPAGSTATPAGSTAAPAGGTAVSIANFSFNPSSLTVKVGDTVSWTNGSGTPHTVTADDGSFDSGTIQAGTPFQHTFSAAGTFTYHCTIHSSMKATIIVTP